MLMGTSVMALEKVDPMRPDNLPRRSNNSAGIGSKTAITTETRWQLQSIQIDNGSRSATINGKRLKIGDKIGNAQLISIAYDQVKLRQGKKQFTLMFLPRTIKR